MFRITQFKELMHHKCTKCGIVIQYTKYGVKVCQFCTSGQRISALDKSMSIPVSYLGENICDRIWYHLHTTNC